ncbi:transmembrane protein 39A-like [Convolutriloba macropyga]|uniref:transmembrane protein 39A-like n=1 Tax=Convolutriloba macropyga TaxID=536237 RepID=UPI003F5236D8
MRPHQLRPYSGPRELRAKQQKVLDVSQEGQITFEILFALFLLLNLSLVYLNIYKTVWWLPNGPSKYIVNFHLFDWSSLTFLVLVIVFRLQYLLSFQVSTLFEEKFVNTPWASTAALLLLPVSVAFALFYCIVELIHAQKLWQSMFLIYPVALGVLFRPTVSSMLQDSSTTSSKIVSQIESNNKVDSYLIFGMKHQCNSDTKHIRQEATVFWNDAWAKLHLAFVLSSVYTYYIGLVPIVLIPENLIYDLNWILFQAAFLFESTLMLLILHLLPSSYLSELYSSALHLGMWKLFDEDNLKAKIPNIPSVTGIDDADRTSTSDEAKPSFLTTLMKIVIPDYMTFYSKPDKEMATMAKKAGFIDWSPSGTVEKGSMVIHNYRIYTAVTSYPAAEPGNALHTKFYEPKSSFALPIVFV